jgi:hypothetical protein
MGSQTLRLAGAPYFLFLLAPALFTALYNISPMSYLSRTLEYPLASLSVWLPIDGISTCPRRPSLLIRLTEENLRILDPFNIEVDFPNRLEH